MGAELTTSDGLVDVRVHARNDPRNRDPNPRLGKRLDSVELVDDRGQVVASCGAGAKPPAGATECACARADDGARHVRPLGRLTQASRRCVLPAHSHEGPRGRGLPLQGLTAISARTATRVILGSPIFVNWPAFASRAPYRQCRLDAQHLPCGGAGCLAKEVDRDQDGWPDDCDVCPAVADPGQADRNKDGSGDACPGTVGRGGTKNGAGRIRGIFVIAARRPRDDARRP